MNDIRGVQQGSSPLELNPVTEENKPPKADSPTPPKDVIPAELDWGTHGIDDMSKEMMEKGITHEGRQLTGGDLPPSLDLEVHYQKLVDAGKEHEFPFPPNLKPKSKETIATEPKESSSKEQSKESVESKDTETAQPKEIEPPKSDERKPLGDSSNLTREQVIALFQDFENGEKAWSNLQEQEKKLHSPNPRENEKLMQQLNDLEKNRELKTKLDEGRMELGAKSPMDKLLDKTTSVLGEVKNSALGMMLGIKKGMGFCVTQMKEGFASLSHLNVKQGLSEVKENIDQVTREASKTFREASKSVREVVLKSLSKPEEGAIQGIIDRKKDGTLTFESQVAGFELKKDSFTDENYEKVKDLFRGKDLMDITDEQIRALQGMIKDEKEIKSDLELIDQIVSQKPNIGDTELTTELKLEKEVIDSSREKVHIRNGYFEQEVFHEFVKLGADKIRNNPELRTQDFSSSVIGAAVLKKLITDHLQDVLKNPDFNKSIEAIKNIEVRQEVSKFFNDHLVQNVEENLESLINEQFELGDAFNKESGGLIQTNNGIILNHTFRKDAHRGSHTLGSETLTETEEEKKLSTDNGEIAPDFAKRLVDRYYSYAMDQGLSENDALIFAKRMQGLSQQTSYVKALEQASDINNYGPRTSQAVSSHYNVIIENGRIKFDSNVVKQVVQVDEDGDEEQTPYLMLAKQQYDIDLRHFLSIEGGYIDKPTEEQMKKVPSFDSDQVKISTDWKLEPKK